MSAAQARRLAVVPDTPPRAVLYLRQSVARDDSVSLELQETAGRDHCARAGYVVVDVVADPGRTGRTFKRRRVVEVLERIERGDADVVVLWKWSRLSRSRRDWAIAVDRVESVGGRIESATEPVDVATSAGRLQRGILAEFAAFESDRIGDVWKEVHERRIKSGRPANGKPRWGYIYDRDTGFTPDPLTGPVLASLYRRYAAGEPAQHLSEWLNAHGYRTSPGYRALAQGEIDHGGPWTFGQLLRLLDSGFGAGKIRYRGELIAGAHPPVITAEEWESYQVKRAERRMQPPRRKGSSYPLSGLVFCAHCTRPMYPGLYGHAGQPKYRCETQSKRGRQACPRGGYITAAFLEDAVLKWLNDNAEDVGQQAAMVAASEARALVARTDSDRLAREITSIEKALARLAVDRALKPDAMPDAVYEQARDELVSRRQSLTATMETERIQAHQHARPDPAVFQRLVTEWPTLPVAGKRDMLTPLIRRINVTPGRPRGTVKIVESWAPTDRG